MQCTFAGNERGGIAKLLVFAIIVGALYAGYYYFQGTPRYALIQFKKAIVFSNGETAEKFLDVDSVANNYQLKLLEVFSVDRRDGGCGVAALVDQVPVEGKLEAVAALVVPPGEIKQGKDHGGRRGLVGRGVVEWKEEAGNRVGLAEAPKQREDDG